MSNPTQVLMNVDLDDLRPHEVRALLDIVEGRELRSKRPTPNLRWKLSESITAPPVLQQQWLAPEFVEGKLVSIIRVWRDVPIEPASE